MTASGWGPDSPADDGRGAADSPPSVAAPARTPVPAGTEERDGREALSDDLSREHAMARVMDPNAHDDTVPMWPGRRVERLDSALAHALAAIDVGYRLVSEDDATVDRVAEKLWREFWREVPGYGITKDFWRGPARAAVRVLREAGQ